MPRWPQLMRIRQASPLLWLRWSSLLLIATLAAGDLLDRAHPALGAVYLIYAGVFWWNTSALPRHSRWKTALLLLQILLSAPLESNLSVVTVLTIPLVIPNQRWWRWSLATVGVVVLFQLSRNAWQIFLPAQLPPGISQRELLLALLAGALEIIAWHAFALLAAVLILRIAEDRQRLLRLNYEMQGAQLFLEESSRLAERLRISRELHDSLGHHLTSLNLQLEVAGHLPDAEIRPKLAQAQYLAKLLLADIRSSVSDWQAEHPTALPQALALLREEMTEVAIHLDIQSPLPSLPAGVAHTLFRAAQEAITNSVRHGDATRVELYVTHDTHHVRLRVRDNGAGCADIHPGNGLRGIAARLQSLAGRLDYASSPGTGFTLEIQIPAPQGIPA